MKDKHESPEVLLQILLATGSNSFRDKVKQELARETFIGGKRVVKQKLPKLPRQARSTVHVVKVSLYGAKPPVWRRLEIPSAMTLDLVHEVLQVAFGWSDYHLHNFETVCGAYTDQSRDDDWSDEGDESAVALAQVAAAEKAKVVYVYDFGDDWRHDVVVESIAPATPGVSYPRCTGGRGETPIEDTGGVRAFNEERAQNDFPVARFDPADVTEALAHLAVVVTGST